MQRVESLHVASSQSCKGTAWLENFGQLVQMVLGQIDEWSDEVLYLYVEFFLICICLVLIQVSNNGSSPIVLQAYPPMFVNVRSLLILSQCIGISWSISSTQTHSRSPTSLSQRRCRGLKLGLCTCQGTAVSLSYVASSDIRLVHSVQRCYLITVHLTVSILITVLLFI